MLLTKAVQVARPARNSSEDTLKFSVSAGVVPMVEVFPLEQAALAFEKVHRLKCISDPS